LFTVRARAIYNFTWLMNKIVFVTLEIVISFGTLKNQNCDQKSACVCGR
jgi:uncharacterized membrane protein SirB2